jgi:hypothetical protein
VSPPAKPRSDRRNASFAGPVITLSARKGYAGITDVERPCRYNCSSIPLSYLQSHLLPSPPAMADLTSVSPRRSILGRTIRHQITVTYGGPPAGKFSYQMIDVTNGATLLRYSATGEMGSNTSVKVRLRLSSSHSSGGFVDSGVGDRLLLLSVQFGVYRAVYGTRNSPSRRLSPSSSQLTHFSIPRSWDESSHKLRRRLLRDPAMRKVALAAYAWRIGEGRSLQGVLWLVRPPRGL